MSLPRRYVVAMKIAMFAFAIGIVPWSWIGTHALHDVLAGHIGTIIQSIAIFTGAVAHGIADYAVRKDETLGNWPQWQVWLMITAALFYVFSNWIAHRLPLPIEAFSLLCASAFAAAMLFIATAGWRRSQQVAAA